MVEGNPSTKMQKIREIKFGVQCCLFLVSVKSLVTRPSDRLVHILSESAEVDLETLINLPTLKTPSLRISYRHCK